MKIMMIDRNSIIDRRIALEAETLASQGYEVELVCAEGQLGEWDRHSFKVTRFSFYPEDSGVEVANHPSIDTEKIQEFREKYQRFVGKKPALLLATILNPRIGKRFAVVAQSLTPWQRYALLAVLNIITLRPSSFKTGLAEVERWLVNSIRSIAPNGDAPEPFDPWEARVSEYLSSQSFDVIHVHDLPVLPLGSYLKKELNKILIYDAHELYSYQPGLSRKAKKELFKSERKYIHDADLVVLINEDQAKIMQRDYGPFPYVALTNATTEPPGFDVKKRYDNIRRACELKSDQKVILFQGGINRNRKIHLLLEGVALAKSKPHMAFLTWGGEIEEFKALAIELKIGDRVHFMAPVRWDEMIFWAASADLGVMPYHPNDMNTKLSMPNKMYEFIVAGTPMIGHEGLINVKKIVGDNSMGILGKMEKAVDYAALIDRALDESVWHACRENILEHRERFSWAELSRPFSDAYAELRLRGVVHPKSQPNPHISGSTATV